MVCVKVRAQLEEIGFFLLSCGSWDLNSFVRPGRDRCGMGGLIRAAEENRQRWDRELYLSGSVTQASITFCHVSWGFVPFIYLQWWGLSTGPPVRHPWLSFCFYFEIGPHRISMDSLQPDRP